MKNTKILLISEFSGNDQSYNYANSFLNFLNKQEIFFVYTINLKTLFNFDISRLNLLLKLIFFVPKVLFARIYFFYIHLLIFIKFCWIRPSVVLLLKASEVDFRLIKFFSRQGCKVFNFYPDSPFAFWNGNSNSNILKSLPFYETFFIWSSKFHFALKGAGCKIVDTFHFFADHKIFNEDVFVGLRYDLSFVGSWDLKRELILSEVCKNLVDVSFCVSGNGWDKVSQSSPLYKHLIRKELSTVEMIDLFRSSKISINILKDQNLGCTNMRTFEIPSCGSLLLAENSKEQQNFFVADKEAVYFSSTKELVQKIKFLLANPDVLDEIRLAGLAKSKTFNFDDMLHESLMKRIYAIDTFKSVSTSE